METNGWRVATAIVAVVGLILALGIYVLLESRNDELRERIEALEFQARSTTTSTTTSTTPPAGGGFGELFEDLLGGEGGDLGDFTEILEGLLGGVGGLGDLGDLGGMLGGTDPRLTQCLTPTVADTGSGIPDGTPEEQIEAIADLVAAERGISSDKTLDVEFTTRGDLARRATEINDAALSDEDAAIQSAILAGLAVIPPGVDAEELTLEALDAAVGGFYNPETEELVIGSSEIDAIGALIVAHEIQHAVADDVFGLPDLEALRATEGTDAATAALGLVEGDASLISQQFMLGHLDFEDLMAVTMESLGTQRSLGEVPHLISRSLQFPYLEGLIFVCDLYLDGGWEAVDAAYAELPVTSAQILFPERYDEREGAVDLPPPPAPSGWEVVEEDTFGADLLLYLFEAPGDDRSKSLGDPLERASAWAGGEVTLFRPLTDAAEYVESEIPSALALVLSDRGGAPPLCESMIEFATAAYGAGTDQPDGTLIEGPDRTSVVACEAETISLVVAPDTATARQILAR